MIVPGVGNREPATDYAATSAGSSAIDTTMASSASTTYQSAAGPGEAISQNPFPQPPGPLTRKRAHAASTINTEEANRQAKVHHQLSLNTPTGGMTATATPSAGGTTTAEGNDGGSKNSPRPLGTATGMGPFGEGICLCTPAPKVPRPRNGKYLHL